MQIQFSCLAPSTRVIELDEKEMAAVRDIAADYLLSMLPHLDLAAQSMDYMRERKAIKDFAKKHGVPFDHPESITNFYRAVLGRPTK